MRAWFQQLLDEAEARQLPALIAEWGELEVSRWISRALQLDLALLIERPELVVTCLIRRTVGFADPAAYSERTVPADAAELVALIDAWVASWRPGRPWLCSVRAPRYPLEVGIVEEYPTAGHGPLRFSDDDAMVGQVGGAAWERATGRRIAARLAVPAPRWAVANGQLIGPRTLDLALEPDETLAEVVELDDELVIAVCRAPDPDDDGYVGSSYLVDVATGRAQWRAPYGCRAARRVGERLFASDESGCSIRDLATGRERGRWWIHPTRAAFSTRGLLADLGDHAIRIWDLERLPTSVPHGVVGGEVELSPDGRRALVGEALIDARDGTLLATLSLQSRGGWLEGGPPRNCLGLTDAYVIQVMPWGTDVWRTADGARLLERDRRHRATPDDAVCYDPHGRWLALYRGGARELELRELPTMEELHTIHRTERAGAIELADLAAMSFSADGDQLWWTDRAGATWVNEVATTRETHRVAGPLSGRAGPTSVTCEDHMLEVEGAAAPVGASRLLVTDGGTSFVGARDHYRLIR